jgi:hypothetical protein
MTAPDPEKEPTSETSEKAAIRKTHAEYIGDMARPSMSKQDFDKRQHEETERQRAKEKSDKNNEGQPPARPDR